VSDVARDVAAVVVDYHADLELVGCVASLRANGVSEIIVVENGDLGSTPEAALGDVRLIRPGLNLGYGAGVNRGAAVASERPYLLVSNPDVVVHDGALAAMVAYLDAHEDYAIVGPRVVRPDGSVYPSHRVFPNVLLAGAHALLSTWWPDNPATRRYRAPHADGSVDWVSGACFLIRRRAFETIGGFDERYFMFAEDMALCWSLAQHGWRVGASDDAVVTHVEGVSRARASRAMLIAHHRSAVRFEWQTARGPRRLLAPLASAVLALRLAVALATSRRPERP
jgi:N-acetylglucosaminyl-diphospho-decaprenol L-rhamnosyltransferase